MSLRKSKCDRVLIVGSWAKEQATIENIRKHSRTKITAYLDTLNPAITSLVDDYTTGSLYDITGIVQYAKRQESDLVIITTAAPLAGGLVDELHKNNINVFGPCKEAARLEFDKSFARDLMKKHGIAAIPEYAVFDDEHKAIDYAREKNWQVAVKPPGLTQGLGVKVYGDQLSNAISVAEYIHNVLNNGKDNKVIIEELMHGVEFTVQCLVNGNVIVPTPPVQDFKRKSPGDKGPNTASMGSYSGPGSLLPFLSLEMRDMAFSIIRETILAFEKETSRTCQGFLYGQFMITPKGLRLIEYNFRPGDPEWINTMCLMKSSLLDTIIELMNGNCPEPEFEDKASVCKYIVPKKYPSSLNETLDVTIPGKNLLPAGVHVHYSCGVDSDGLLNVGDERGVSFTAKADSIHGAHEIVEQAISRVGGKFDHRNDIGTDTLVMSKKEMVKQWKMI